MIVKGLFELVYSFLNLILTPFQIVPDMPGRITYWTDIFLNFLFTPINLFVFFFNTTFLKVAIVLLIAICNMTHIWDGIIWILKKLPFVGIE